MTFLEELGAARSTRQPESDELQLAIAREWVTARPDALFDELATLAPTFVLGRLAFVTRYADVMDVLRRHHIFSVGPYSDAIRRINRGPNFLLGLDEGPEYQQHLSVLRRAFPRDDADRVREAVRIGISQAVAPALVTGRLDLADGYGRLVPALFAADYFGVPGPDPQTLMKWARAIFTEGFVNVVRNPVITRRALRASEEFRTYLDALIDGVRADPGRGHEGDSTVLERLLALEAAGEPTLGEGGIRDNVLWTIAGMIDNVSTGVCSVLDCLLGEPALLQGATDAVVAGDATRLRAFVLEALRFRTPTPVAVRMSLADYTLSHGTPHEKTIKAGTLVLAGTGAAMMDASAIDAPKSFRLDRPPEHYLHFGAGLHQCLGAHIAMPHLTEMTAAILKLRGLRRAKGLSGRLRYAGPFPKPLIVQFEPGRV